MASNAVGVVNQAIQYLGDNQKPVTGSGNYPDPTFDSTPAGVAAQSLYVACVNTVARQFGWDFSRGQAALVESGNTPPVEWDFEYVYPTNGIEVRQIMPGSIADPNNPLPINWTVGNTLVSAAPTKVIWTDEASAIALFTNQPPESLWDAGFTEAVARLLSQEMAMALAGRPNTAAALLESAEKFGAMAETRLG